MRGGGGGGGVYGSGPAARRGDSYSWTCFYLWKWFYLWTWFYFWGWVGVGSIRACGWKRTLLIRGRASVYGRGSIYGRGSLDVVLFMDVVLFFGGGWGWGLLGLRLEEDTPQRVELRVDEALDGGGAVEGHRVGGVSAVGEEPRHHVGDGVHVPGALMLC